LTILCLQTHCNMEVDTTWACLLVRGGGRDARVANEVAGEKKRGGGKVDSPPFPQLLHVMSGVDSVALDRQKPQFEAAADRSAAYSTPHGCCCFAPNTGATTVVIALILPRGTTLQLLAASTALNNYRVWSGEAGRGLSGC
jgi:hypothetical protein